MTRWLRCSLVVLLVSVAGVAQAQIKVGAQAKGAVGATDASAEGSADVDVEAVDADAAASEADSATSEADTATAAADSVAADADSAAAVAMVAEPATPVPAPWRDGLLSTRRGYAGRPLNARRGVVRLDFGPSDFAYMNSGEINSGRGFQLAAGPGGGDAFTFGAGIAVGLFDCLELGALVIPLRIVPDEAYGDAELYARHRITRWLSAQLAFQLPSETDFGMGIGFPMLFPIGDLVRLDTGIEAELVFADDFRGNLDIPVALNFNLGERGFAGVRTGVFLSDFADLAVSAGLQMGVLLDDSADITASFSWPRLVWTGAGDSFNGDVLNISLGLTVYIDARDKDAMKDEARL
jgi:hypothetical protein